MNEGWKGFIELCLASEDEEVLSEVLTLFLTPEEKESVSTRYLIVKELLSKERTQRQMADELKVSIAKITRGSNELKRIEPKFKAYLEKMLGRKTC